MASYVGSVCPIRNGRQRPERFAVHPSRLRSRTGRRLMGELDRVRAMGHADGPLHTSRESVQPNRDDLMYWAQGLTQTYLEGALNRAVSLSVTRGDSGERVAAISTPEPAGPRAVLDPFDVWEQGEHILVRQLAALNSARLRDIAVAYGFATRQAAAGEVAEDLVATIVDGVRNRRAPM
jgi:hypothetical protein